MPNITCITLGTRALAKSLAFYKALGFKPGFVNDEVAFIQLNNSILALYRQAMQSKDLKLGKRKPVPGGMTLAINLASKKAVDAFFAKAKKAGAKLIQAPHAAIWGGYTCYFSDPDGHAWEIAWNPFWKLDKKGNVKL
jgi:uncharacterized protein